jgi:hypothetical protein
MRPYGLFLLKSGTEKTLLNCILGILSMSSDAMSNPKHPFVVTFVKLVKDTSVAHLGARDTARSFFRS